MLAKWKPVKGEIVGRKMNVKSRIFMTGTINVNYLEVMGLVSKGTAVQSRWGVKHEKLGFFKAVDN